MKLLLPTSLIIAAFASQAVAGPSPAVRLSVPSATLTAEGTRVEGAVCRRGPHPVALVGTVEVRRLGKDGAVLARESATLPAALRDRGPRCANYHVQTAWLANEAIQVCVGGPTPACVAARR